MSGNANLGGCAILGLLFLVAVGSCLPKSDRPSAQADPRYVTARSLNCRSADSTSADVVASFRRGEPLMIAEERGDWSRVEGGANCWVAARYLARVPPAADADTGGVAAAGGAAALLSAPRGGASGTGGSGGGSSGYPGGTVGARDGGSYDAPRGRAYVGGKSSVSQGKMASVRKKAASWKKRSTKRKKKRSGGGVSGGSCPCSGYNVCIGPRGGRYCITSGGNKRYGV
ncbi:SH3 domain-containing protein [Sphingopyxis sp. YR583]|uniref:SH3 domain-containing protein n=1 Tax=Sphingopyxis sp. YR583 TaxID=1881047 RepID=UPI0008A72D39|nr:SH3 domain-containing protein [Sphingopyxis sp. YR583]SEH12729.1 SH3 domain-containing protein [Sphingopyxis sp. YR583]